MNIIEVKDLSFEYPITDDEGNVIGGNKVLENITVDIPKGQFVAILGHNGSGKSTLAKHFNGMLLGNSGKVYVNGTDTADDEKIYDIRQTVGMVFQNPDNQLVATIVEEDVAFAPENLGLPPAQIRERVDEALNAVDMYKYRLHSAHQLSGGQKQRIAIAGVIAMRPECIVLDEPTAMLDPKGRKSVMRTIKRLNREFGITVVLITHYMDEAAQAERVIVMDGGRIIMDNVPKKIFSQVDRLTEVGLDVPQVTQLAYELKKEGIEISLEVLTEEDMLKEIQKLVPKR
ncbi:MAG: energy-coupling factor transporter ATPase [Ruminiclostridium sp.]|jgi:energy-coupling factor transport system ATP-binding protein|nr:energy-coupling factor transporter ATPase [Ruminiclostridium sp.]